MTETLIAQKVAHILASVCEGEWFSYLFSILRKRATSWKKIEKKIEIFFDYFICSKNPKRKKFRRHFWPKT